MKRKFKSQRLPKGINPVLLDEDLVARMCAKSSMLFGVKWRWRVMCGRHNIDPVELEKRFDTVIEQQFKTMKEQVADEQPNTDQQLGNDNRGATTDGTGETKESTVSRDAGQQPSSDSKGDPKAPNERAGQEVRSREAGDVTVTTRGSE